MAGKAGRGLADREHGIHGGTAGHEREGGPYLLPRPNRPERRGHNGGQGLEPKLHHNRRGVHGVQDQERNLEHEHTDDRVRVRAAGVQVHLRRQDQDQISFTQVPIRSKVQFLNRLCTFSFSVR